MNGCVNGLRRIIYESRCRKSILSSHVIGIKRGQFLSHELCLVLLSSIHTITLMIIVIIMIITAAATTTKLNTFWQNGARVKNSRGRIRFYSDQVVYDTWKKQKKLPIRRGSMWIFIDSLSECLRMYGTYTCSVCFSLYSCKKACHAVNILSILWNVKRVAGKWCGC